MPCMQLIQTERMTGVLQGPSKLLMGGSLAKQFKAMNEALKVRVESGNAGAAAAESPAGVAPSASASAPLGDPAGVLSR